MISNEELIVSLRLARSENIGRSTFFRLVEIFGTPSAALEHLGEISLRKIKICSQKDAEEELVKSRKFGAEILLFSDEKYPRLLREIPDPSPILTVKGNIEFFDHDCVAIVGARNASFNSSSFARRVALDLGQNSIITVSGMARGIDAAAHEASILSGTIGVIAGGINTIYPSENRKLYDDVSRHGLLVTESPFNAPPKGGNFVQRNRLISGLSLAVIVIEAGVKSGSLITARFAAEQGREVFAVPGSPFDPRNHGTNRLIKDGANMFEKVEDILNELPSLKARFKDVGKLSEPEAEEFIAPQAKMPSDAEITKVREEILARLTFVPIEIDQIISELQISVRLTNIALVQLELADRIEIGFGKVVLKN